MPHSWQRLLLKVEKTCFYPIKYYCGNSIIDELQKLVLRKDFPINWELWRKREVRENISADVYDGNLWKKFQNADDSPLNFDFFPADETPLGLFRWSVLLSNFKSAQVWTVQMGEYHYCRRCSFIGRRTQRFKRISSASCGWVESLVERDQDQSYP